MEWLCNIGPIWGTTILGIIGLVVLVLIASGMVILIDWMENHSPTWLNITLSTILALFWAIMIGYGIWDTVCS